MITITINVTKDCKELLATFPRYAEVEMVSENYDKETGKGIIVVNLHSEEAMGAVERALDCHDEVISYL